MAQSVGVGRTTGNETVSEAVVYAVAERTGSDPVSMEPLYDVVDPDALDSFFETNAEGDRSARSVRRIEFTYCGCDVRVTAGGDVHVSQPSAGKSISDR